MMTMESYTEDQRDCLQEICNVAMGQAADVLAREFGVFVSLPIPVVSIVDADQLAASLKHLDSSTGIYASSQLFSSESDTSRLGGLALVVLTEECVEDLASLMGSSVGDAHDQLLGKTCHNLTAACLSALAEQWDLSFVSTEPVVSGFEAINNVCLTVTANWSKVLLVEINYQLEGRNFNGDLLLLFPDDAIESVARKLDKLLAD